MPVDRQIEDIIHQFIQLLRRHKFSKQVADFFHLLLNGRREIFRFIKGVCRSKSFCSFRSSNFLFQAPRHLIC